MEPLPTVDLVLAVIVLGAAALLAALFYLWRWDQRRRMRIVRSFAVTSCGFDHLRDVLVPDGQGSALHVDFLLLTARGLSLTDRGNSAGILLGGDQWSPGPVFHLARRYPSSIPRPVC